MRLNSIEIIFFKIFLFILFLSFLYWIREFILYDIIGYKGDLYEWAMFKYKIQNFFDDILIFYKKLKAKINLKLQAFYRSRWFWIRKKKFKHFIWQQLKPCLEFIIYDSNFQLIRVIFYFNTKQSFKKVWKYHFFKIFVYFSIIVIIFISINMFNLYLYNVVFINLFF